MRREFRRLRLHFLDGRAHQRSRDLNPLAEIIGQTFGGNKGFL
ncbi:MAG: hypothetical protein ABSE69_16450 [Roseiarcus sp.]|jgi:hypothetical protein